MRVEDLRLEIGGYLAEIAELFKPGMKLTFIARMPGNDEADVLITDDSMGGIEGVVRRSASRETHTPGKLDHDND